MKTIGELFAGNDTGTTETMTAQLEQYMKGILSWNEKINLTAIRDPEEFVIKHYVDSLRIAELPEFQAAETVIDVGTGGGFPGVPLAAAAPEKRFLLMDSLNKRIKVILELTAACGIGNVEAVHGRAEDLGRDPQYREQFDLCVSRAVADLSVLSEYCLPFVKPGGAFIAYKGSSAEEELGRAERAIRLLGGEILRVDHAGIDNMEHRFIVIRKVRHTQKAYPRKAGTPAKSPL